MKKVVAMLICMILLLMSTSGVAEETNLMPDLARATPLIDLTAAAAIRTGQIPEIITVGSKLSENFVYQLFLRGSHYDPILGLDDSYQMDIQTQEEWMRSAFVADLPALSGILSLGGEDSYIGVRVMSADLDLENLEAKIIGDIYEASNRIDLLAETEFSSIRWLDKRAVVTVRVTDENSIGWQLVSFSINNELEMEEQTAEYFNQTMTEYYGGNLGFSIQYPAVFTEDTIREEANGLSAELPDHSASFFVRRISNVEHKTAENVVMQAESENNLAETTINPITGCATVVQRSVDYITADLYLISEEWIYQAELKYSPALQDKFSLYLDYMTNSFNADENGVG